MSSVRILPIGSARCGARVWRTRDKAFATVVVKATFQPAQGGALVLAEDGDAIIAADEHVDHNPTRSLRDASDLAPYLPRGEALLFGSAHSTGGTRGVVRLVVARGSTALVDRRVVIRGDDAPRGQPLVVPLVFERAAGGPGHKQNPVGTTSPLLVDPKDPAAPGAFGPIAAKWPARAGLLGADQKKGVTGKVWRLDDVSPEYFHAAPTSQRAPSFFAGDETIWIDGVTPNGARIEWRLPGARAEAHVMGANGARTPVQLVADVLRVDVERRRVSLVFRGYFPVLDDDERPVVAAGVAMPGTTLAWPDVVPPEAEPVSAANESARPKMNETAVVHMEGLTAPTLPFGATKESVARDEAEVASKPPVPGAPWAGREGAPPSAQPASANQRGTFEMPRAGAPPAAVAPPPMQPPAPAPIAAPPQEVVPVAPVAGALSKASVHLPRGLGSELLYALRDDLPKEGR